MSIPGCLSSVALEFKELNEATELFIWNEICSLERLLGLQMGGDCVVRIVGLFLG